MSKKPTSYLLFVYGTFGETEEEIQLYVEMMGEQIFDVVSDGYLPYTLGPYHAIYKFNSVYEFSDLKERIDDTWQHMCHSYFFIETTDNLSYKIGTNGDDLFGTNVEETSPVQNQDFTPETLSEFLNGSEQLQNEIDFFKFILELKEQQEEVEDEDPQVKKLKQKRKKKVITLDEVLEKITTSGIESITKEEKQILDNYANGK